HVFQREIPIHDVVELILVDLLGDLRKLSMPDVAAIAHDAGEEDLRRRLGAAILDLPVLEFTEEVGRLIDRCQGLQEGDVLALREEESQGEALDILEFRSLDMK